MHIRAIASATPEWKVDSATIASWSGLSESMVRDKIGVRERGFLRHNETGLDLAIQACRTLFADQPELDPHLLQLLVFITQTPDHRLPHNAALLQAKLGLANSIASFDLNLGCSGYVHALSITKGIMMAEGLSDALIVTSDPYSKIMRREDRDTIGLFGDGATATWLSADGVGMVGLCDFGTDGTGAGHLTVVAGGGAQPRSHLDGTPPVLPQPDDLALRMNGRAILNFMLTRVPATVDACLQRNGLTRDQVDHFVFHQASRFLLETLADRMKLPREKVPIVLENTGNTVSSTIPMALEVLIRGGCRGQTMVASGFGVGLSWATTVIRFT